MTKDMRYMSYDELTEYASEVMEELRRKAYAEGYEDGKNVERMALARKLADDALKETPQQARDRIVEKAKADVSKRLSARFVINKEKRTIVALYNNVREGRLDRGIAKCAPGDCFNVHIGKAIALRRALELEVPAEYLNAPQPTEVRVGDVIERTFKHGAERRKRTVTSIKVRTWDNETVYGTAEGTGSTEKRFVARIIDDSREE